MLKKFAHPLQKLAHPFQRLAHPLEGLAHLLFPKVCVVCRTTLDTTESQLCAECLDEFAPFATPFGGGEAVNRSVASHFGVEARPAAAWSLYPYSRSGALHDAIHSMKYEGLFPLGRLFGRQLGERIQSSGGPGLVEMIVPVPLHPLKRVERSYNQSAAIAAGIAEVLNLPVAEGVLERRVYTSSQASLSMVERRKNIAGAFLPTSRRIDGRVLLVDDVLTTGATLVAAASALRQGGAEEVAFAVVAVTKEKT